MNQPLKPSAIATKIKKWLEAARDLRTDKARFGLPITRLTSIKSLCQDERAAGAFALHFARQVQQRLDGAERTEQFSPEEWEAHKNLVADSIERMNRYLTTGDETEKRSMRELLRQIDKCQGDDIRRVHWTTVHFVRSGYLLKIEYALRCFVERDFPYRAYQLAREYVETYQPSYGTGLTPDSVPMLLEVAAFWCQYYFSQSLSEKFPAFSPSPIDLVK